MRNTHETLLEKNDWIEYINDMGELVERGDWNQLESLLTEEHPTLPGEREAFLALEQNLERLPLVELDESGFHVVSKIKNKIKYKINNMREAIELDRREWTGPQWNAENAPSVKEGARLREEYISYNEAMKEFNWELVKKNQPFDPAKPSPVYPKRIQFEIFNRLDRLGMANQYDDVFYYSAGKSMLDLHGVDGWFEYGGGRAAVDWTVNEAKKGGYKSILIFPEDVEIPEKFDEKVEEIINALLEDKRQKAAARKQKSGYRPLIQRNRK